MIYQQVVPRDADEREKAYAFEHARRKFAEGVYDFLMQHKRGVVEIDSQIRRDPMSFPDYSRLGWGQHSEFDIIEFKLTYTEVAYEHYTVPVRDGDLHFYPPPAPPRKNIFQRIASFLRGVG